MRSRYPARSCFMSPDTFLIRNWQRLTNRAVNFGHGGHFFGTAHTIANYTTAFYEPIVSDWSNFETWVENGEQTAFQRANKVYRQALKDYQEPEIDSSIRESLQQYADERRREVELAR